MKAASVVKVVGATAASSSAVATPTSLAVINHNQKVAIAKQLEEAGNTNERLIQENKVMDDKHKELQRLDASESYKNRQEIIKLKEEMAKEKAVVKELQNKLKEAEQYSDKLKDCVHIFTSSEPEYPQVYDSHTAYQQYQEQKKSVH